MHSDSSIHPTVPMSDLWRSNEGITLGTSNYIENMQNFLINDSVLDTCTQVHVTQDLDQSKTLYAYSTRKTAPQSIEVE